MIDIEKAEAEIAKLQREVEEEKARLSNLTPDQKDAEFLHDKMCRLSHEDNCSWFYETWTTPHPNSARRRYLVIVKTLTRRGLSVQDALQINRILNGVKD